MTTTPMRIQRRRAGGWKMPANTIYVGRPGKWGNPYRVGQRVNGMAINRLGACNYYRGTHLPILVHPEGGGLDIQELRGHNLACWCELCPAHQEGRPLHVQCKDCEPCHVDILLPAANP